MCFSFSRIQAARCSVFAPKWTPIAGSLTSPAQNVLPSHISPAQHRHIPPQKMHSSGLSNPTLTEIHVALKRVLFLHDVEHTWPGSPPPRPFPGLSWPLRYSKCAPLCSFLHGPRTKNKASSSCGWKANRQDWVQRPDDMSAEWFYFIALFSFGGPDLHTWRECIWSLRSKKEQIELIASVHRVWIFHIHKWRTIQGIWSPLQYKFNFFAWCLTWWMSHFTHNGSSISLAQSWEKHCWGSFCQHLHSILKSCKKHLSLQ